MALSYFLKCNSYVIIC